MKQTAHINEWVEVNGFLGSYLIGTITNHTRQNEFSSDCQRTSPLVSIDRDKRVAETQNTIYTLGKEIEPPDTDDGEEDSVVGKDGW